MAIVVLDHLPMKAYEVPHSAQKSWGVGLTKSQVSGYAPGIFALCDTRAEAEWLAGDLNLALAKAEERVLTVAVCVPGIGRYHPKCWGPYVSGGEAAEYFVIPKGHVEEPLRCTACQGVLAEPPVSVASSEAKSTPEGA